MTAADQQEEWEEEVVLAHGWLMSCCGCTGTDREEEGRWDGRLARQLRARIIAWVRDFLKFGGPRSSDATAALVPTRDANQTPLATQLLMASSPLSFIHTIRLMFV